MKKEEAKIYDFHFFQSSTVEQLRKRSRIFSFQLKKLSALREI